MKSKVRDIDALVLGTQEIDLSAVEQLVEVGQVRAIATAILTLHPQITQAQSLNQVLHSLDQKVMELGLEALSPFPQGDLAQFRRLDVACVLNRLRTPTFQSSVLAPSP
ncbi:MAG: hypothetical protein VKJ24_11715 [Synechococcales bacterium]|nr:hypothetical protein [Synechococcales bacterium]